MRRRRKKLWPFDGFLFQKLTIDHSFLSSLSMKAKSYNGNNGAFDIDYLVRNQTINQYFKKDENEQATLGFGSYISKRRLLLLFYNCSL